VYFGTGDIAATVAAARDLRATILNEVVSPVGPLAVIADPQGAVFQVMQPTEWPD
jgi:predicted enzyme related to lactoylglutathione lyase